VIGSALDVKIGEDEKKPKRERVDFCTNAIVLDCAPTSRCSFRMSAGQGEFRYRETKSLVLVYLDPVDGQVKERIAEFDKNDPLKKRLSRGDRRGRVVVARASASSRRSTDFQPPLTCGIGFQPVMDAVTAPSLLPASRPWRPVRAPCAGAAVRPATAAEGEIGGCPSFNLFLTPAESAV